MSPTYFAEAELTDKELDDILSGDGLPPEYYRGGAREHRAHRGAISSRSEDRIAHRRLRQESVIVASGTAC